MAKTASRGNAVDISGMDLEELRELRRAVDQRIAEQEEEQQRSVYDEIHRLATDAGTSVEQLLQRYGGRASRRGSQGGKKQGGEKEARYRNPQNPDETWSGRGRQPKWLSSALKSGRRLEEFAVS
ncbi:MAG TPA: H-NS histone family protein [Thermoanaerobaculia bacterium]|nr:H-NS histone family protein [Thermoanaerobaculia bacterium]